MSREILFRAKTKATKEWTYGHFAKQYDVSQIYAGNGHECIYEDTLCQYTGLADRNGNKIFEGDIIQSYHHGEPMGVAVVYWQGSSFWCDLLSGSQFDCCYTLDEWNCECGLEIIGNIFDNKDIVDARE